MIKLKTEFQTNADMTGLQTFKQIQRTGDVALYQRIRADGTTHSYESFLIKTVKAGTVFAKGAAPIKEDYESYPGKAAFGRYAYSCKTLEQAEKRFNELVAISKEKAHNKDSDADPLSDDSESIKSETVKQRIAANGTGVGKRGRKAKEIKMPIPKKGEKFTMKNLMVWSNESQPNLYNRLKPLIEAQLVGIAGEIRESHTRGKAQILYISHTDEFVNNMPQA